MQHITSDERLMMSNVICFPETWIWTDEDKSKLDLHGFKAHHNAVGKGRGISVYYEEAKFTHTQDTKEEKIQLTKLSSKDLILVVVYKAPGGNDGVLRDHIANIITQTDQRSTLVFGDFNMCFIDNKNNRATKFLIQNHFKQLVKEATHIEGGHIDQVYIRSEDVSPTLELYSPYYTSRDHDCLCITFPENEE